MRAGLAGPIPWARPQHPPPEPGQLLHALPATPAARRRAALPTVLLGVAALAFGGLAVLPAVAPTTDVLIATSSASSPLAAIDLGPQLERLYGGPVVASKPPVKPVAKKPVAKPAPRPAVKRVSRSKRAVAADLGDAGYFCPVAGRRSFTNDFGDVRSGGRRHQGNDILAAYGTPLVAVTAGTVRTAYSSAGGVSLYLQGVDGVEYFYAHNSRNVASSGERVAAGEVIAYVGTSGNARGGPAHVHFERHPGGGGAVNPYYFLIRAC